MFIEGYAGRIDPFFKELLGTAHTTAYTTAYTLKEAGELYTKGRLDL